MSSSSFSAYACYNKNSSVRAGSTSGGFFSVVAEYCISQLNGIVYGAAFDENFSVEHIGIEKVEDIAKLRGSKYPQSRTGKVFQDVHNQLLRGRVVLFSGTPCQVAGLKAFLKKEYENLFCVDFVCHGVASRKVWREYIASKRKKGEIQNVIFKSKPHGWKKWYFRVEYIDGTIYQVRGGMNEFMRSYLTYCNIRPSCYSCHFKGLKRLSDLTISDCWGKGERDAEINDDKGLSALVVQSEKGEKLFQMISDSLVYKQYMPQDLMEENWTMFRSVTPSPKREKFFLKVEEKGSAKALASSFKPSVKNWIGYYWMRIKGKEK